MSTLPYILAGGTAIGLAARRRRGQRSKGRKLRGKVRERPPSDAPQARLMRHPAYPRIKEIRKRLAPYQDAHQVLYSLLTQSLAGPEVEGLYLVNSWISQFEAGKLGLGALGRRLDRLDARLDDLVEGREPSPDYEPAPSSEDTLATEVGEEEIDARTGKLLPAWQKAEDWYREAYAKALRARGMANPYRVSSRFRIDGRPAAYAKNTSEGYLHPGSGVPLGPKGRHGMFYLDGSMERVTMPDVGFGEGMVAQRWEDQISVRRGSKIIKGRAIQRGEFNRRPVKIDPVMDPAYNLREVYKQCILLEDHLANPRKRCQDCISKHCHAIEALVEEARGLDKKRQFDRMTAELHRCIRKVQEHLVRGKCPSRVAQEVRGMRKKLNPLVRLAPPGA